MSRSQLDALALSRKTLRVLTVLNLVAGMLIGALLIASLIARTWVFTALGVDPAVHTSTMIMGMRLVMVIGICAVPITHVVLARLLAIVDTVTARNPFVHENAERLKTIAWAVLGLELLHLCVGAIAAMVSTDAHPLDLDWNFSFTRWLAVLLLFVLAIVFEQGAAMRDDLEGTV
jgi:hypothetical protein